LNTQKPKQESQPIALVARLVRDVPKDVRGRLHIPSRGHGEEDDDDEEGEANVDEDEALGEHGKVSRAHTVEETVDDEETSKETELREGKREVVSLDFGMEKRMGLEEED
jgi:hypothetical protein